MAWRFSERAEQLQSSAIREILKVTMRPEIIHFAGRLPSPETVPVETMQRAFDAVLSRQGKIALQYGPSDGYKPLVDTPSYLGALQAFSVYQPAFVSVPTDDGG